MRTPLPGGWLRCGGGHERGNVSPRLSVWSVRGFVVGLGAPGRRGAAIAQQLGPRHAELARLAELGSGRRQAGRSGRFRAGPRHGAERCPRRG